MSPSEKQDILDRLNEAVIFAFKLLPASVKQIDRVDFSSLQAYLKSARELADVLERNV